MVVTKDLKILSGLKGPCLTVIQPLAGDGQPASQTETAIVAAAQKAAAELSAIGFDDESRTAFLRPLLKVAHNTHWSGRKGSLVFFRSPGFEKAVFWPATLRARVRLNHEFLILPLLASGGLSCHFWVLALSINRIGLFRGTTQGLTEVDMPARLPGSLADAEFLDTPDRDLASRSAAKPGSVHFGTSSLRDNRPDYLHDFFKMIDRALQPLLAEAGDPLIIAAVPKELAIYRRVNQYPHLLAQGIHGNPFVLGEQRLHQKALDILNREALPAEHVQRELEEAAARGLTVTDLSSVADAAEGARVRQLFVAADVSQTADSAEEDLINSAALAVLRNSGDVICAESLKGHRVTATLRYNTAVSPAEDFAELNAVR